MPDIQNPRVAVYLDFDNIVMSWYDRVHGRNAYNRDRRAITETPVAADVAARLTEATVDVGAIIDYAASFGTLVLTRAYADWSAPVNAEYRAQVVGRAVDLVQLFPAAAYAKNGADIRLAVDTVEDMFRLPDLTHVVIVAGDSDYVPLAQRCKRLGRFVVGVGVAGSTAKSLAAACDQFVHYDSLPGVARPTTDKQTRNEPATRTARKAPKDPSGDLLERALRLEHERTGDEWMHASVLKGLLMRMDPAFSEKALGFKTFTDFISSRPDIVEMREEGTIRSVRLVPSKR